ncbi:NADPH:quinone reductase [Amycolatopsis silviterrae]|uniref:NADPH:quinone reductase n=1 Tax=Amycolatopsis silviterrae TaxID=1656914 RepID=A0ABW5HD18_9PSEU
MIAAYVTSLGGSSEIKVGPLPDPSPGPREVLVKVSAVAVNHVDTFVRSGAYRTDLSFPFVIGRDLVGTVVSSPVDRFAPGDRVWCNSLGHDGRQGSFSEYCAVPADRLYPLPDGVSDDAVAVLHPAATAYLGLFEHADAGYGETIVVLGAGGGVGSAVVQLASTAGMRVIATARAADAEWCRECGADEVFDYADPDLYEKLPAADVLWDNAGRHDLISAVPLLARGGRIVAMAGMQSMPTLPIGELYTRDASIRGFAISNAGVAALGAAARVVNRGLSTGILRARIGARLPLSAAAEAHRAQEEGEARGRIVLEI